MSNRIGVDIDGVLADFNTAYGDLLIKISGEDKLPEGWKEDPTFPLCWNWDAYYGYSAAVEREAWIDHIMKKNNFWLKLRPLPHAREALGVLNSLTKNGLEVFFITNRPGLLAKIQTERWLYEHGMNFPSVLIAADKTPLIRDLGLTFFIDDKISTMIDLVQAAEKEKWLSGKDFYLKAAPYNQEGRIAELKVVPSLKDAMQEAGLWPES